MIPSAMEQITTEQTNRDAEQVTLAPGRLVACLRGAAWAGGLTPTQAEILTHLARQGAERIDKAG